MTQDKWPGWIAALDDEVLREHVSRQPWFRPTSAGLSEVRIVGTQMFDNPGRAVLSAVVEARHRSGTSDFYQLLLLARPPGEAGPANDQASFLAVVDGWTLRDAMADPDACRHLLALALDASVDDLAGSEVQHIGSDVSSSSVRIGDQLLKAYRELRPGPNVELEWLRVLRELRFEHVPVMLGSLSAHGQRVNATLALAQEHIGNAVSGTEHLGSLAHDPAALAAAAGQLGEVIAALHQTAQSAGSAAFAPNPSTPEGAALLVAEIEDELDETVQTLDGEDDLTHDLRAQAAVARDLAALLAGGGLGCFVRTHGDLRMRHALYTARGWMLVGFQGDLAQSASSKRRKRPGLWDVACGRRSIVRVGEDLDGDRAAWARAADAFSHAYRDSVDSSLLPARSDLTDHLLDLLEVARVAQLIRRTALSPPEQRRWKLVLRGLLSQHGATR